MRGNHKIKSIEELASLTAELRADNKKIVHCHGVFDPLHVGHIRHFREAKRFGEVLVVTVTPDEYVNKGPHRPVFTAELRAEAIAALEVVDYVSINKWPMAIDTIRLLRPDFFVKGSEYVHAEKDRTGAISLEEEAVTAVGGQLVFTDDLTFSASNLVNRHLSVFPKEVTEYLNRFADRYDSDTVLSYLEAARAARVLVVGEAIVDEYQYCETMGKSGKEPIMAARSLYGERFAGGVLAIANHVASFSDHTTVLTFLGERDSHEGFIREQLNPSVSTTFLYMSHAPTIVKRRFVERYPFQKLFEVYEMGDDEGDATQSQMLCGRLEQMLPDYDVVIVADYGHGMISPEAVDLLCSRARFLAVNTQVNAANRGFNTIAKYPRADYICISESEIRLDARSRRRDLRDIVLETAGKLNCGHLVITRGQMGALCYSADEGFVEVPALASQVVDRVGAGDAVLAVTALCVAQRSPIEVVGLLGNAVGAQAVTTVANRRPIERTPLVRYVECLLK